MASTTTWDRGGRSIPLRGGDVRFEKVPVMEGHKRGLVPEVRPPGWEQRLGRGGESRAAGRRGWGRGGGDRPTVLVATLIDSTSMFHDLSPGATNAASNALALLAAVHLVGSTIGDASLDALHGTNVGSSSSSSSRSSSSSSSSSSRSNRRNVVLFQYGKTRQNW